MSKPMMIVAVVALVVVCCFGTATAAGVTKAQVKKIAAKVIAKKAPGLSVAHAATANSATHATNATNATNAGHADTATSAVNADHANTATNAATSANSVQLNGLPGSAYQNQTYRFRLPQEAAASEQSYTLTGIPAGNYIFTFSVLTNMSSAGVPNHCSLRAAADALIREGLQYGTPIHTLSTCSGGGSIQLTGAPPVFVVGAVSGTMTVSYPPSGPWPSTVTFTRVDSITSTMAGTSRGTSARTARP